MNYYDLYKELLRGHGLPQALVDLDNLDFNLNYLLNECPAHQIRIASKSIRSLEVLKYIQNALGAKYAGIMAYYPEEAFMLAEQKCFGDILLAYPYTRAENLINFKNDYINTVSFMVDCEEHLVALNQLAERVGGPIRICIDIDMSVDLKVLNFGVYRSSIKTVKDLINFVQHLEKFPNLKVVGLMGYEAQVAGLADKNPYSILNFAFRFLKFVFSPLINKRRESMAAFLKNKFKLEFINGGGTASLPTTTQDKSITEVTIGSGFYCPQLFSYYKHLKLSPSAFFALEITRKPKANYYTCAGGGFVASGAPSWDKIPRPYLPVGGKLTENEACGEVQTPIYYQGDLKIGDPFFFRHSKAGELCERFNQLILIKDKKVWKIVDTYRGMGHNFL